MNFTWSDLDPGCFFHGSDSDFSVVFFSLTSAPNPRLLESVPDPGLLMLLLLLLLEPECI